MPATARSRGDQAADVRLPRRRLIIGKLKGALLSGTAPKSEMNSFKGEPVREHWALKNQPVTK
jgi:hypothetical protein